MRLLFNQSFPCKKKEDAERAAALKKRQEEIEKKRVEAKKKLEEEGIGRPSTYANIIQTLQRRYYVEMDRRRVPRLPGGQIGGTTWAELSILGYSSILASSILWV